MIKKTLSILITVSAFLLMTGISIVSAIIYTADTKIKLPEPAECNDPNAVTFDDGDFFFASADKSGIDSADGELVITEIQGNRMLEFHDSGKNFENGTVQKIKFDAARLLSPESLKKVRSIELDVYADATADKLITENGENVKAPGWIGGGGGASVSGDKWYKFGDWEGGEYNFERSGAVHIELKFLLASSGRCWDGETDEATFLIMRWGAQNEGNFYIDNIVFYDENKNSLPIEKSKKPEKTTEKISDGATEPVTDSITAATESVIYSTETDTAQTVTAESTELYWSEPENNAEAPTW